MLKTILNNEFLHNINVYQMFLFIFAKTCNGLVKGWNVRKECINIKLPTLKNLHIIWYILTIQASHFEIGFNKHIAYLYYINISRSPIIIKFVLKLLLEFILVLHKYYISIFYFFLINRYLCSIYLRFLWMYWKRS